MASTTRSDGTGSIYQRHKPGCPERGEKPARCRCPWQAAYVTGWHGEKPVRKKVTGKSRADAARKLNQLIEKVNAGQLPHGRIPTVAEWTTYWLEQIVPVKASPGTVRSYHTHITKYVIPLLGDHRLDRLTPEHISDAWAALLTDGMPGKEDAEPLSPTTVAGTHTILSRSLKVAVQREFLTRNPVALVDAPRRSDVEADVLTHDQGQALIDTARDKRNAARWTVALSLGLRQGEALGLRWPDVDMESGLLTVRKSLTRVTGRGLVLGPTKGKRSRIIKIPAPLFADLKAHRTAQNAERLAAGSAWVDDGYVFAGTDGRPIDPKADWTAWRDLVKAAGLEHVKLHSARHTAATMLLARGVPIEVVAEILGHTDLRITRGYQHRVDALHDDAAEKMAGIWK